MINRREKLETFLARLNQQLFHSFQYFERFCPTECTFFPQKRPTLEVFVWNRSSKTKALFRVGSNPFSQSIKSLNFEEIKYFQSQAKCSSLKSAAAIDCFLFV